MKKFAVMSLVKVELPQNQFCHHLGMVRKSLIPKPFDAKMDQN